MRPKSYTGVTGFMHRSDVEDVLEVFPADSNRLLMVGVLASGKTLRGIPNNYPKRYPNPKGIDAILVDHPKALNLLHFNTRDPERLLGDMVWARSTAGFKCHGLQLNIAWPSPSTIERYKKIDFGCKTIVLQCGGRALDLVNRSGAELAARVRDYAGLIDYVLVDPSGGTGKLFDVDFARECFTHLDRVWDIGYGIAGGLEPKNLYRLHELLDYFPDFSIDAEGRLRNDYDDLDPAIARNYVHRAETIFGTYQV